MPPDPEVHPAVVHVLEWYWQLEATRTSNGFGVNPITYQEIESWSRLTGNDIRPHEVVMIKKMDSTRLATLARLRR